VILKQQPMAWQQWLWVAENQQRLIQAQTRSRRHRADGKAVLGALVFDHQHHFTLVFYLPLLILAHGGVI